MKRSQIILLSILLVLSALIYIPIVSGSKTVVKQKKEEEKVVHVPTRKVENQLHRVSKSSYGQVAPNTELIVSFEVQGRLMEGGKRLKPGVSFRKGEVLYRLDGKELEYSLIARKMSLASMITQALPDFILDFPEHKEKWESFLIGITKEKRLPEFPKLSNRKEQQFWTVRNVPTEYFNIISQEERISKYTYTAPFSGTVIEIYSEPGAIANPGGQIAKIARTGEFEIRVPVALGELEEYKSEKVARFTDPKGGLIATGKIIRISDVVNQRTQSADVYYSVKPEKGKRVYNGLYLNVGISHKAEEPSVVLPRTAIADGKVLIMKENKLSYAEIHQISSKPDSVYVTGLSDGQEVVLDQIGAPSEDIIYKSVER